ncbi:MAG: 4'-phosphopantetheinyl transferase family protein [Oscillospiraceae bacterium]|jgi:hypothetical protein
MLKLYYADIRGLSEADALYPPRSAAPGSAFGTSLLAYAYRDYVGLSPRKIARTLLANPWIPDDPGLHYSLSHSKTHVLVALSDAPVGIDAETHRKMPLSTVEKLTTPAERACFPFFDTWVLRESYFKLTDRGNLRTLRFYRRNGKIIPPDDEVFCRLYRDIDGCSVAVCAYDDKFPDALIRVPPEKLLKADAARALKAVRRAQ